MPEWPTWWEWELELTSHLLKRMLDRSFNEIALRQMLDRGSSLRKDIEEGRREQSAETFNALLDAIA